LILLYFCENYQLRIKRLATIMTSSPHSEQQRATPLGERMEQDCTGDPPPAPQTLLA
jgi:hypothetical protein